jgi:hypothetical protein
MASLYQMPLQVIGGTVFNPNGPPPAQTPVTDNTGGTASTTLASIAAGAAYSQADATAIKNALASLALAVNSLQTQLRGFGLST